MPLVLNGPLTGEQRKRLQHNLVHVPEIARRAGVKLNTVSTWARRFDDWPAPVIPHDQRGRGTGGIWWWPDVAEFLENHGLPKVSLQGRVRGVRRGRAQAGGQDGTVQTGG